MQVTPELIGMILSDFSKSGKSGQISLKEMSNPLRDLQTPGFKRRGNPGGPHSKTLRRGPIGDNIKGNSAPGRFIRAPEAELTTYVGGNPDIAQRPTIDRIIKLRMQLDNVRDGTDRRTCGALHNAFRLTLSELERPRLRKATAPRLEDVIGRHRQ